MVASSGTYSVGVAQLGMTRTRLQTLALSYGYYDQTMGFIVPEENLEAVGPDVRLADMIGSMASAQTWSAGIGVCVLYGILFAMANHMTRNNRTSQSKCPSTLPEFYREYIVSSRSLFYLCVVKVLMVFFTHPSSFGGVKSKLAG